MKELILQAWEESEQGWGTRPDGYSLHTDTTQLKKYLEKDQKQKEKSKTVPHEYSRTCGNPRVVMVNDDLYNKVAAKGSLRFFNLKITEMTFVQEV